MKGFWIGLIIFWITVIFFPELIGLLVGGFFIFIWINLLWFFIFLRKNKKNSEDYVNFWEYKIYRNKK